MADGSGDAEVSDPAPVKAGDLLVAASLLTRAPVPVDHALAALRAAPAVWAYPLVGAALGAISGGVLVGLMTVGVPVALAAIFAIAVTAIATGALHEDGLADCADGIGGGWSAERRLEIMKDSRVGAYGALALILASLARLTALVSLSHFSAEAIIAALALAGAVSRAPLGAAMRWIPNARAAQAGDEAGLSASVGRPPAISALLGLALGAALAAGLMGWAGLIAMIFGCGAAAAMLWIAKRKLGGQTGDVLGAAQVLTEIAALTALFIAA